MADHITLDVIDRPAGGALRALHALGRRSAPVPGLRGIVRLRTGEFKAGYEPNQTPRRIALLGVWDPQAEVERSWHGLLGEACGRAREHWHVRGELTRASFTHPWRNWTPDAGGARALRPEEPALILISGNLRPGGVLPFVRDGAKAAAQAFRHPGYLGGLALLSSPLNTTSCSAWRSYADARDYAFAEGGHLEAMKRDRANRHHVTECFLRIRPLASSGTLNGRRVFAS